MLAYSVALRSILQELLGAARSSVARGDDAREVVTPIVVDLEGFRVRVGKVLRRRAPAAARAVAEATDRHVTLETKRVLGFARRSVGELAGFVQRNTELITSLGEDAIAEVTTLTAEAAAGGLRVEELQRSLVERLGVVGSRAELIARDQTLTLNAQLSQAAAKEAGVTRYRWSSSRDERVREGHAALEGQICSWDDPPIVDEKTGERGHPGEPIQCRCIAIPIVEDLLGP
jgi:SPP1 gp7 family putative phage head morphogenesis protein